MLNISRIHNLLNFTLVSVFPPNFLGLDTDLMHYPIYSLLPFTSPISHVGDNN